MSHCPHFLLAILFFCLIFRCLFEGISEEKCRICVEVMRILIAISHGFASIQALKQLLNGLEMLLILKSISLGILAMKLTMTRWLIGGQTVR